VLQNTRRCVSPLYELTAPLDFFPLSLGDLKWKPYGVTSEPEVRSRILHGPQWACMVLISDGISSVVSDDEVVDIARKAPDPKGGAEGILRYAEEMGSDDNLTAIVVPLAGWGKVQGPDRTKDLREYRRRQMGELLLCF